MEDVLPNDGQSFAISPLTIPEERQQQEDEELAQALQERPFIEDELQWYVQEITRAGDIDSIDITSDTDAETLRAQIMCQRLYKNKMTERYNQLNARLATIKAVTDERQK